MINSSVFALSAQEKRPFPEASEGYSFHKALPGEFDNLSERVRIIAKNMGFAPPQIWVEDAPGFTAVAHESNNVVVTKGVLKLLTTREQNAILAHELGHKNNKDELKADERSIQAAYASNEQTHSPEDLISALKKLTEASKRERPIVSSSVNSSNTVINFSLKWNSAIEKAINALPDSIKNAINTTDVYFADVMAKMHYFSSHPSLERREENILSLKKTHDGIKR